MGWGDTAVRVRNVCRLLIYERPKPGPLFKSLLQRTFTMVSVNHHVLNFCLIRDEIRDSSLQLIPATAVMVRSSYRAARKNRSYLFFRLTKTNKPETNNNHVEGSGIGLTEKPISILAPPPYPIWNNASGLA